MERNGDELKVTAIFSCQGHIIDEKHSFNMGLCLLDGKKMFINEFA